MTASIKAIAAAATHYAFMHHPASGYGVVLNGPLGCVAAWEDTGEVELLDNEAQAQARASSSDYWACYTDPVTLEKAQAHFRRYSQKKTAD